jgi:hypothetical protein
LQTPAAELLLLYEHLEVSRTSLKQAVQLPLDVTGLTMILALRLQLTETRKRGFLPRATALHMVMASAAAVASSSSDALLICMPVRSQIIVWKFSRLSSLWFVT